MRAFSLASMTQPLYRASKAATSMTSRAAEEDRPEPLNTVLVTEASKPPTFVAQLLQLGCDAADQREGGLLLVFVDGGVGNINHEGLVIAGGIHGHNRILAGRDGSDGVQIDRSSQHTAIVMVGVVSANLSAAGSGHEHLGLIAEMADKGILQLGVAGSLVLAGVEGVQTISVAFENSFDIHLVQPPNIFIHCNYTLYPENVQSKKRVF